MNSEPQAIDARLERLERISIVEGAFAQAHTTLSGAGSVFITKFALMLGAGPMAFGLLSAFGQLALLFQPLSSLLTRRATTRRAFTVFWALAGRLMVPFYGLLPLLLPWDQALRAFLAFYLISAVAQSMSGNAWMAWIGEMVPTPVRGRFLARRSRILLVVGASLAFAGGALVDRFQAGGEGFARPERLPELMAVLFGLATLLGVIGLAILWRQPEDPKTPESESARELLSLPFRDPNFRRLLFFNVWWMLAIGVGAPFWQPYMITGFHMSLVTVQIYGIISTVSALATVGLWGRFVDRFGNRLAMAAAIVAGGINPIAWLVASPDSMWIVYLEAASSGSMWAGAGLVGTNFVLAIAPSERKQIYAGVLGAVSGMAMMATMITSGAALPGPLDWGAVHLDPEKVLFALSALLRWTALVPLVFVAEPVAPPATESLYQITQFAKVRVATLAERVFRLK